MIYPKYRFYRGKSKVLGKILPIFTNRHTQRKFKSLLVLVMVLKYHSPLLPKRCHSFKFSCQFTRTSQPLIFSCLSLLRDQYLQRKSVCTHILYLHPAGATNSTSAQLIQALHQFVGYKVPPGGFGHGHTNGLSQPQGWPSQ